MFYVILSALAWQFYSALRHSSNVLSCGLFGAYSRHGLSDKEVDVCLQLGIVSAVRGIHSTGVIIGKKKKGVVYYDVEKSLLSSSEFLFQSKLIKKVMNTKESKTSFIVGHTRHATVGSLTEQNAHPHKTGSVIGCHNGTISNFKPTDELHSDSAVLFSKLADVGLQPMLKEVESDGAFALSWLDTEKSTINFVRNTKRPLYFTENSSTMYWASEAGMLDFVLSRSSLFGFKKHTKVEPYLLYSVNIDTGKITETPLKTPPRKASRYFPTNSNKTTTKKDYSYDKSFYFGYYMLSTESAKKLLASGCDWCGEEKTLADTVYWYGNDSFICSHCYHQGDAKSVFNEDFIKQSRYYKGDKNES